MFNKLKTTTLAAVTAAATLLGGGQAWAFATQSVPLAPAPGGVTLGNCAVYMGQYTNGSIQITVGGFSTSVTPFWANSVIQPDGVFGRSQITISDIQACGISDASSLVSDAANGTFAADDYYGFSVEGTESYIW